MYIKGEAGARELIDNPGKLRIENSRRAKTSTDVAVQNRKSTLLRRRKASKKKWSVDDLSDSVRQGRDEE